MKKNLLMGLMSLQIGYEHASNLSFMEIELLQNPLSNTAKVRVKLQPSKLSADGSTQNKKRNVGNNEYRLC